MSSEQEILNRLRDGVVEYENDMVINAANEALETGLDAEKAIFDGLVAGIEEIGRLYELEEIFVPEMLLAADAMYAGLNILKPHMEKKADGGVRGHVIMGVVQGDVHDIGKNIVKMMFDVAGFEVHDLGRDVPLEDFIEEQLNTNSDLVCLSAMMTTTMVGMPDIIRKLKEKNPKVKIMIGGAPVNENLAEQWGADGYAKDANNALKDAINMVASLRNL
ncbi:MAG: cobalamin-binding protein [Firmicutes bacterium HGW-Firmicutes-14]|jgi:corrinoid protein of di/trimethylamine methyltransferase|nr:MAG: cobalamin-binding protein [Firmicutes bacterium HGW-Firmicutes-14]